MTLEFYATRNKQKLQICYMAKEIWETTHHTYSKAKDYELCYNIKTQISATKQGNISKWDILHH